MGLFSRLVAVLVCNAVGSAAFVAPRSAFFPQQAVFCAVAPPVMRQSPALVDVEVEDGEP